MSTYVISDIHGALEPFQELLSTIEFDADSEKDELYLLGDYADWGKQSIETLGYIMDLDQSPHVHCIMGNHDLMFLQAIESYKLGASPDMNWYGNNKGYTTWDNYLRLSESNKEAIHDWLYSLDFAVDVRVGEKLYMAAHAYPYFGKRGKLGQIYTQSKAVWQRARYDEDPFIHYHGRKKYDALIIGHTPTAFYYYSRTGRIDDGAYRIFFGKKIIAIDCGAKLFDHPDMGPEYDKVRLGALRLEDEKCFYVR
ncbi:MAG: metallophosphoesterase [Lachnospiraceae bacterium]|nr:metallophosphoesterase [Lachnospiraceae bacterium]